MTIHSMHEAEDLVYSSYMRAKDNIPLADDSVTRDISLTKYLLRLSRNPEQGGRYILVTGSKGKGSTSRLMASLLTQAGFKTGLYTSPHLVDFTERIQVNGSPIPEKDFITIMNDIESSVVSIDQTLAPEKYLSPIGISLTAALIYFKMEQTDINVIECGRGGRYDDTNVLENEWAVVTPVMDEHLGLLGQTILDVARHKLGIIKESTEHVFIGRQSPDILDFMREQLPQSGKSVFYFGKSMNASNARLDFTGTHFNVETNQSLYQELTLPLLGTFQADNAAVAIKVCETILGGPLNPSTINQAFQNVTWPGRCEIINKHPTVILDGAINALSAIYLGEIVHALKAKNVISIIAVPKDKDYKGVVAEASGFSEQLIITEPARSHKQFPVDAIDFAKTLKSNAIHLTSFEDAYTHAREMRPDLILIMGTQTFIGEVKFIWNKIDIK